MSEVTTAIDSNAVTAFLYDEAALLDRPDLDRWVALFTEDGAYWMPASVDQPDPLNHISLFYDDRVMMEVRRRNFVHPRAGSKDHPVRCSHLIGNVRVRGRNGNGDYVVTSNFHVAMFYRDEQRLFAGTCEHQLASHGDSFLIRRKRVDLINCDAAHKTIIVYL